MRARIWLIAAVVGLSGLAFGAWQITAQSSDEGIPAPTGTVPYAGPGTAPRAVNGHVPPPTAVPTATPDLGNAVSPDKAWAQLSAAPNIKAVLDAISVEDVGGLLLLVDWQPHACGVRDGELCARGLTAGTELPMVNVSDSVPYWITEGTLRAALAEIVAGGGLSIGFASRVETTSHLGDRTPAGAIYLVGLEGSPRPVSASTIWGDLTAATGFFFTLDSGASRPILALSFLSEDVSATSKGAGSTDSLAGQEIITFNPR